MSNRIVVDLKKVQFAWFFYENQYHDKRSIKPSKGTFTIHNTLYSVDDKAFGVNDTVYNIAKKQKSIDNWTPVCMLAVTANRQLKYTGKKAVSIWKEWNSRIFGK